MSIANVVLLGFSTGTGGHLVPTLGFASAEVAEEATTPGGAWWRRDVGRAWWRADGDVTPRGWVRKDVKAAWGLGDGRGP